jgi:hypothetical protein
VILVAAPRGQDFIDQAVFLLIAIAVFDPGL